MTFLVKLLQPFPILFFKEFRIKTEHICSLNGQSDYHYADHWNSEDRLYEKDNVDAKPIHVLIW